MKKRILVLGGTGFIGSHLVEALTFQNAYVRVFTKSFHQNKIHTNRGVEYYQADFTDTIKLAEALVDMDIVVHLISTTVPSTANMDPIADICGNLIPTVNLLQKMRNLEVPRLVFISSGGTVYGNTTVNPIPENHPRNPLSSYGIVKAAIENYIFMFCTQYGLDSLIVRASNPYGPRQGHIGVQGIIPTIFKKILLGEQIKIWGDGSVIRDYIYIDDLITFLIKGINHNLKGIFNVGSGIGTSLNELLSTLETITGNTAKVKFLPPREFDVKKVVLDISKANNAINWNPKTTLHEGCLTLWKHLSKTTPQN